MRLNVRSGDEFKRVSVTNVFFDGVSSRWYIIVTSVGAPISHAVIMALGVGLDLGGCGCGCRCGCGFGFGFGFGFGL
jgi:hypothetical protein